MEDREKGTVKWFNAQKGYGFIARQDSTEVFVHYSQIETEGFRTLDEGQSVEFTIGTGDKGLHAQQVIVLAA